MARQIFFKNAADPAALAAKLTTSPFFKRNAGVAQVDGSDVRCVFEQGVARQKLLQACSENFKKWGAEVNSFRYDHHVVGNDPLAAAPAASSAAPAASSAARDRSRSPRLLSSALAVRTSVADIKAMAAGLTPVECRSLAVHFALCGLQPVQDPELVPLLAAKAAAAAVFQSTTGTWESQLNEHAVRSGALSTRPLVQCGCKCGCQNQVHEYSMCHTCSKGANSVWCCKQCLAPSHARAAARLTTLSNTCHACLRLEKDLTIDVSVPGVGGMEWYFDHPKDKPWLLKTRDVSLDPALVSIVSVHKGEKLEHDRRARPFGWERAFSVGCMLRGPDGVCVQVVMTMQALLQNPDWAKDPKIAYVRDWLPSNLAHLGAVFSERLPHPVTPQCHPGRPEVAGRPRVDKNQWTKAPPNPLRFQDIDLAPERAILNEQSSVQIEELPDDEDSEGEFDLAVVLAARKKREAEAQRLWCGGDACKDDKHETA